MKVEETPSPRMPAYMAALRENPYLVTLDRVFQQKCQEVDDLAAENMLLRAEAAALQAKLKLTQNKLAMAKRSLGLWRIRHKTWVDERRELTRAR